MGVYAPAINSDDFAHTGSGDFCYSAPISVVMHLDMNTHHSLCFAVYILALSIAVCGSLNVSVAALTQCHTSQRGRLNTLVLPVM